MADRLTMMPLFQAMLDFDSSPEAYEQYDRMSALELFKRYGVSKRRAPAHSPRPLRSPLHLITRSSSPAWHAYMLALRNNSARGDQMPVLASNHAFAQAHAAQLALIARMGYFCLRMLQS